ncbi:hypothetical protein KWV16_11645 [Clostridioides difficile]|nr:hypothetical protein [Clostridioides difficile]
MFFTYGIGEISKNKFKKPHGVSEQNKIQGGIWCCPKHHELYSEWFILTLANPQLTAGKITIPYDIEINENAKILKLTTENINLYTNSDGYIDFNKIKEYDALHFTKELVESVKRFESYYVESIQILDFDVMQYKESYIDKEYIQSEEFVKKGFAVLDRIYAALQKTDAFKIIKASK